MAEVKRAGTDVTIVATLAMVQRALQAADQLEKEGMSVEVIDPRTLRPLDIDTIVTSVRKTSRCIVVHEAWRTVRRRRGDRSRRWMSAPSTGWTRR